MIRWIQFVAAACLVSCGPGPSPLDPLASWLSENYESYWAPSENMFPTLLVGDFFMARKHGRDVAALARGTVVVFVAGRADDGEKCPLDRCPTQVLRESHIARIVGTPGDVVSIMSGHLFVDGESAVARERLREETTAAGRRVLVHEERIGDRGYEVAVDLETAFPSFGPFVVEEGRYFLVGDYRSNSYDSRIFGTIQTRDVIATVASIYWSREPNGAVRWGRIGDRPR